MKDSIIQLFAALGGSVGYSLLFGLNRRYIAAASLGGMAGWGIYLLAEAGIGGVFFPCLLASAFAALYSEMLARLYKAPSTLFFIPSVVPLVPGSALYYTISYAVRGSAAEAWQSAFTTLKFALAIASGFGFVLAFRELRTRQG